MIQLEVGGRRYGVRVGELVIGSGPGVAVPLFGDDVAERHAVVQGWADGSAAIRSLQDAVVQVNGIRQGDKPTPILHGDKITIGAHELLVTDDRREGQTRHMPAIQVTAAIPGASRRPPEGRVVSLTDGREYVANGGSLVFGRDAAADIVVDGNEVSRRHAELHASGEGYALLDTSVNGTYVNGEKIGGTRTLVRGDVIRIGAEEFRFHGGPAEPVPAGASERLSDTMFGMPAFQEPAPAPAPPPGTPPLASVLFRSGPQKGERVPLRVPVVNVGRADYNDLCIADPSVSTMHAKIQRRDGVWLLTDLGSTNGTFADGVLVSGDLPLGPGATIKFGEVSVLFEPLDNDMPAPVDATRLQRAIEPTPMAVAPEPTVVPDPAPRRPQTRIRTVPAPAPRRTSWWLVGALLIIAAGLAAWLFLER